MSGVVDGLLGPVQPSQFAYFDDGIRAGMSRAVVLSETDVHVGVDFAHTTIEDSTPPQPPLLYQLLNRLDSVGAEHCRTIRNQTHAASVLSPEYIEQAKREQELLAAWKDQGIVDTILRLDTSQSDVRKVEL